MIIRRNIMKRLIHRILYITFLLGCISALKAQVRVSQTMTVKGAFPIAISNELFGGAHSVADISARDAVAAAYRQKGMLVTVLDASADGYAIGEVVTYMYLGDDKTLDDTKWLPVMVVDSDKGAVSALEAGDSTGQVLYWNNTDSLWLPIDATKITMDTIGNVTIAGALQIAGTQKVNGISSDVTLGGINAADSIIPTQKAVKSYIDSIYTKVTNFNFIRPTSTANWGAAAPHVVSWINSSSGDVKVGYTIDDITGASFSLITTLTNGQRSFNWTPGAAAPFDTFKENVRLFAIDADLGDTTVSQPFSIFPPFDGDIKTLDSTICYNSIPTTMFVENLSGSGTYEFTWQYFDGANWITDNIGAVASYSPNYTITKDRNYQVLVKDASTSEVLTLGGLPYTIDSRDPGDIVSNTVNVIGAEDFAVTNSVFATAACNIGYRYVVTDNGGNEIPGYIQPSSSFGSNESFTANLGCSLLPQGIYRVYRESRWGDAVDPVDGGARWDTLRTPGFVTVDYDPVANVLQSGYTVVASKQLLNTETLTIDWDGCESADYDVYYSIDGSNYNLITTVNGVTTFDWTPGNSGDFSSYQATVTIKVTISGETTNFEATGETFEVFPLPSAVVLTGYDDAGNNALENTTELTIDWTGTSAVDYDLYYSLNGGAGVLLKTVTSAVSSTWTPGTSSPFDTYQGDVTLWVAVSGKSATTTYGSESESFKVYQTSSPALSIAVNPICYNSSPGEISVINLAGSEDYTFVWQYWDGAAWQNDAGAPDAEKYTPSYTISTTRRYQVLVTDNILGGTLPTASLDVSIAATSAGDISSASVTVVGDNSISLTSSSAATAGCGLEYMAYVTDNTGADISGFTQPDSWSTDVDRTINLGCSELAAGTYRVYRKAHWGAASAPVDGGASYDEALSTSYVTVTYSPVGTVTLTNYTSAAKKALLNTETLTLTWEGCIAQSYDIYYSADNGVTTNLAASGISSNTTTWTPGTATPFDVYQDDVILYVVVAGKDDDPKGYYASATEVFKVYPALTASVSIAQIDICYNSSPGEMSVTGDNGSTDYSYSWQTFKTGSWIEEGTSSTYNPSYSISDNRDYRITLTDNQTDASVDADQTITIATTDAGDIDKSATEAAFPDTLKNSTAITIEAGAAATSGCNLEYRAFIADDLDADAGYQPDAWSASETRSLNLGCSDLPEGSYRIYRQARWGAASVSDDGDTYLVKRSTSYASIFYMPVTDVELSGLNGSDAISKDGTLTISWAGCAASYDIYYVIGSGTPQLIVSGKSGNSHSWMPSGSGITDYTSDVKIIVAVAGKSIGDGYDEESISFTIFPDFTVALAPAQSICYNQVAGDITATPDGGSSEPTDYIYSWENGDAETGPWNSLSGTGSIFTPTDNLIANKWYRVTATDNTTGKSASQIVKMTVEPTPGAILNGNINYNYAVELDSVNNSSVATNGSCAADIMYRVVVKTDSDPLTSNIISGNWSADVSPKVVLDSSRMNTGTYYLFREVDYDGDRSKDSISAGYRELRYNKDGLELVFPTTNDELEINTSFDVEWQNGVGPFEIYYDHDNDDVWELSFTAVSSAITKTLNLFAQGISTYSNVARIRVVDTETGKSETSDLLVVYESN